MNLEIMSNYEYTLHHFSTLQICKFSLNIYVIKNLKINVGVQIEVWNLLFVREVNGKYPVYCVQCARKADFTNFAILQQYTFDDLSTIFDQFRLYPVSFPCNFLILSLIIKYHLWFSLFFIRSVLFNFYSKIKVRWFANDHIIYAIVVQYKFRFPVLFFSFFAS